MKAILFIFVLGFYLPSFSQKSDLTIQIEKIAEIKGLIQIGVYNEASKFPKIDGQYKLAYIDVSASSVIHTISDLPDGEYAIAVFHDKNSDGICNLNFLGIPLEPYGFSNNVKPVFSAPSFRKTKINVSKNTLITIKLID